LQKIARLTLACLILSVPCAAQQAAPAAAVLKPGDNLVIENIPPIPMALAERTARYGDSRSAVLYDWHPTRREILIGTRFGDTSQVHAVAMPLGERRQLTFFPDRVSRASYLPNGTSFLFQKDTGGGEWFQLYRYDLPTGDVTLLTDGKSRNDDYRLAHHSTTLAYSSTQRNNKDTDIWLLDANDPTNDHKSAHMLLQVDGGGWSPLAWSVDNKQLLVSQYISVNESYLWLVDAGSGAKRLLTPKKSGDTVAYSSAVFSKDGKSIYAVTDQDSEFARLARFDLATMTPKFLTADIPWNVEELAASEDGQSLAFTTNENGYSKLYVLDTKTEKYRPLKSAPDGVLGNLQFHPDGQEVGFSLSSAQSPLDAYSINLRTGKLDRWTASETGGLNPENFVKPSLVKWKSFDGREISGFLYQPDAKKFPGKRPVIIYIHGGPESQDRPTYIGQDNYILNELGVAFIDPNIRGSTGYGKTFAKLDNGFKRDDSYKDVSALLDWIPSQPGLDPDRVMAFGGSYGGHMTWAVAAFYGDRIRCAMPIVGMSNLVTFLEHTEAYRRDLRRAEYGDERDPAMRAYLEKIAPMNHLDTMHKPIFAVVGKNDPRVPWTESRQILDKLNAQGTPTWFLMANDEGHGYAKKKNRDYLFNAEVLFIQTYLIGGK
jgi:dipeptidyl aminopeptidase/acylaminoacyl peptidase